MFYIGMALASLAGGFIQTMVGFGAAVAILLYLNGSMGITLSPSVSAVVCLVLNISIFLDFRKALELRKVLPSMLIYSVISLLIVFTIKKLNVSILTVVFGIFLIIIAVWYLFLSKKIKTPGTGTGTMIAFSSISGVFAGLFSIGGPTLSLYYLALLGTGDAYIAGLQFSFLAANFVMCFGRVAGGLLTAEMVPVILIGIAGALAGQFIARRIRGKLSTDVLAKLVYLAVGLSGVLVILQEIF